MNFVSNMSNFARSKGDPKVLSAGPSSLGLADRMARALGWFSIGLGAAELVAPRMLTRALGMEGRERLVRAYGLREIGAGVVSLSASKEAGLWSRVAGDALDIATVLPATRRDNPKRHAAGLTLALLAGVALIDFVAAQAATSRYSRGNARRSYRDRSGFPRGLHAARGAARDSETPTDMLQTPVQVEALVKETTVSSRPHGGETSGREGSSSPPYPPEIP